MKRRYLIDDNEAQAMRDRGMSMQEIADYFGVPYDVIRDRTHNSVEIVRHTDLGKAQALRNAGWDIEKIAKELGTTVSEILMKTSEPVERRVFALEGIGGYV